MSITEDIVLKVAHLARLNISKEKVPVYVKELSNILGVINQLQELNVEDIHPMSNPNEFDLSTREDNVVDGNVQDNILKNAPQKRFDYFVVPKVID